MLLSSKLRQDISTKHINANATKNINSLVGGGSGFKDLMENLQVYNL